MKRVQIVGTQRSGSNLLRLLLGSLPGVFAPPSAHKLRDFQNLGSRYYPLRVPSHQRRLVEDMGRLVDLNALTWPRVPDRSRAVLADMSGSTIAHAFLAFYDSHARYFGKNLWVSKCLENVHFIDQLSGSGLPILYLHLVRDPRDVAMSFSRAPIGPKDHQAIALRWLADQTSAMKAREVVGEEHWLTLRYEDLVKSPEAALSPLCDRMEVSWSAAALEFYRKEEARTAAAMSELWENLDQPIRRDRVSAFKRSANSDLVMAVESVACEMMSRFGYVAANVSAPTRVSAEEKVVISIRDRKMRAELAAARDPEAEAVHLKRQRFLDSLMTIKPQEASDQGSTYVQFAQKAVIEWRGRLLLIRKSRDDPHQPGRWEFPGGRMKSDELPDEALVREVREEVGLDVSPGRPLALWSWRLGSGQDAPTVIAVARLCEVSSGDVDMSRNDKDDFIERYGWFDREEILDLDLIPSARGPIAAVIANL